MAENDEGRPWDATGVIEGVPVVIIVKANPTVGDVLALAAGGAAGTAGAAAGAGSKLRSMRADGQPPAAMGRTRAGSAAARKGQGRRRHSFPPSPGPHSVPSSQTTAGGGQSGTGQPRLASEQK